MTTTSPSKSGSSSASSEKTNSKKSSPINNPYIDENAELGTSEVNTRSIP